jgi:hypothetical protein
MTNITWHIEAMDCKPQEGDLTDVVITAHYRCNGTDGTYNATVYGTSGFTQPGEDFTPYADLTQEQVLAWCWNSGVDKVATEASIESSGSTKMIVVGAGARILNKNVQLYLNIEVVTSTTV